MSTDSGAKRVRVAIIGAGAVSDYHHVPGLRLDPRAELAAVCDADPDLLETPGPDWGVEQVTTDPEDVCDADDVDAVIIATPNFTHRADRRWPRRGHGKHVMCEKPLGLNAGEVRAMYQAARDAGVVHMTAFTYRFAPSMRYLRHLVQVRRPGRAAALPQPAVPRLARDELGLAAVPRARPAPATCST